MVNVVMPQFGETVTEGEITRWLVMTGDAVAVDQPIAEISTDKVDTEVLASDAGTVTALLVEVGTVVQVGTPLLELDGPGSPRVRATPKARRLAAELGVDLTTVASPTGAVRSKDVVAATGPSRLVPVVQPVDFVPPRAKAAPPMISGEGTYLVQHSRVRRITAQRTRESLAMSATAWSVVEVDYANVDLSRTRVSAVWKARYGSSLTYLPYVLRAVSLALVEYPLLNAEYRDDGLLVSEAVQMGVAVDLGDGGLGVPVLRQAQALSVADIALELSRLAGAARSGTLGADAYAGSTFAVTNNGSYGSVLTMPIINQPNVGILSFDAVSPRPSVVAMPDGTLGIGIRPKGALALSWDHRAVDGAYAARFLTTAKALLETTAWDVSLPD